MTDFVALYRGRTVSEAELIAVSADEQVVRLLFKELLGVHLKEVVSPVVARTVLTKREDAAINRMEVLAQSVAGENPEIAEAVERIRTVRGPNEEHTRVFRLEAITDLWEKLGDLPAKADEPKPQARKPQSKPRKPKS